jgi:hypothetical protein
MASKNKVLKSYIGMGYYNTHVPPVILRNVLENPGWYTQYTPYQAEIAQGRCAAVAECRVSLCVLWGGGRDKGGCLLLAHSAHPITGWLCTGQVRSS